MLGCVDDPAAPGIREQAGFSVPTVTLVSAPVVSWPRASSSGGNVFDCNVNERLQRNADVFARFTIQTEFPAEVVANAGGRTKPYWFKAERKDGSVHFLATCQIPDAPGADRVQASRLIRFIARGPIREGGPHALLLDPRADLFLPKQITLSGPRADRFYLGLDRPVLAAGGGAGCAFPIGRQDLAGLTPQGAMLMSGCNSPEECCLANDCWAYADYCSQNWCPGSGECEWVGGGGDPEFAGLSGMSVLLGDGGDCEGGENLMGGGGLQSGNEYSCTWLEGDGCECLLCIDDPCDPTVECGDCGIPIYGADEYFDAMGILDAHDYTPVGTWGNACELAATGPTGLETQHDDSTLLWFDVNISANGYICGGGEGIWTYIWQGNRTPAQHTATMIHEALHLASYHHPPQSCENLSDPFYLEWADWDALEIGCGGTPVTRPAGCPPS